MIHIYYGFGKGKTSTLNGSILRAKGAGFNPIVFRFLKGRLTNEDKIIKSLEIPLFSSHSSTKFVIQMNEEEKEIAKNEVMNQIDQIICKSKIHDFIVLDEFLDIVYLEFITQKKMISILKKISKTSEVLISGHYELTEVFKIADLITYYDPKKHYFNRQKAREGIEF